MIRLFLSIVWLLSIAFGQIAVGVMNERGHEMREVDDDVYILNLKQEGQTILKLFAVVESDVEYERVEWSTSKVYQVPHMRSKVDFPIINPRSLTNGKGVGYTMFGPLAWMSGSSVVVTARWNGWEQKMTILFGGGVLQEKIQYNKSNKTKGLGA